VLLGIRLADIFTPGKAGAIATASLGGAAALSAFLGARGDHVGRRRAHVVLSFAMVAAMCIFAFTSSFVFLLVAALTGTVATTFLEAGPFVALEQAMLPHTVPAASRTRAFGRYTATAYIAGSLGALAAGGPEAIRRLFGFAPPSERWFLLPAVLALLSAGIATQLSASVETPEIGRRPLQRSRGRVYKLSALFALDGLGGGFVVNLLVAYWFHAKFGTPAQLLGLVFFGVGVVQSLSVLLSTRIAERIGLVKTMVFTHLPSNVLLILIPFAPNEGAAIGFLLGRFALSQMDVPARQSYVVALVDPEERTAASAFTTTARSAAQAPSPWITGSAVQTASSGLPFYLGGGLKILYDILLWRSFRALHTPEEEARRAR
jgi:predicted MFS family arabinose efflux permease